jgi:putative ABC transport system permease protein
MHSFFQDLRYGARNLRNSLALTTIAVLTLAIGIGANTAIFSVVDAVLLRPLPFRDSGRLVRLYETEAAPGHFPLTGPDYLDWKAQAKSFEGMALYGYGQDYNLSGNGHATHVSGTPTEANFFSLLGARALLGRTWAAGEDQPGQNHVLIISYGLWQSQFGGDRSILDRQVELNNLKYSIVGVMPPSFRFPANVQLWVPHDMQALGMKQRGSHWTTAIGRLKSGVTVEQAQSELSVLSKQLEQQYPGSNSGIGAFVQPLQEDVIGDSRDSLLLMLAAVGLVLLIACANVANLLLARSATRQKEMAVRSALGAARARLVRQLLTESLLLAFTGSVLGLLIARAGIIVLLGLKYMGVRGLNPIEINLPVLAFTLVIAALAGIVFGIFPALQTSRPDLFDELRGAGSGAASQSRSRRFTSNTLIVAEVGISVMLLISAGLLLKDFVRLRTTNIGIRPENILTAGINLPEAKYPDQLQQMTFYQAFLERSSRIPGVQQVAFSDCLPLVPGGNGPRTPRGGSVEKWRHLLVQSHSVSPQYFRAMGIPIVAGRGLTEEDVRRVLNDIASFSKLRQMPKSEQQNVVDSLVWPVVINQRLAREFWPKEDPLGKLFSYDGEHGVWWQVVGVAADVKQASLSRRAAPESYAPFDGDSSSGLIFLVVHSSVPPETLVHALRTEVAQLDPTLPLFDIRTMNQVIAEYAAPQQILSTLIGIFAAIALALAAIGIYGVLSYAVTQRTREIGIRISLGARSNDVLSLVLRQGFQFVLLGLVLGIAGAFASRRLLASSLQMIQANDLSMYIVTPLLLLVVAGLACYIPARRASRVDPLNALRYE